MAVYTQIPAEEMAELVLRFDAGKLISAKGIAEGVENSNYLVETTKGRFIFTVYEKRVDTGDLPFFMAMIDHLVGTGNVPALADEHDVLIRTPIGGVVTSRDAQPGTVVLPGAPLVSVGNPDRLQLQMHLSADAAAGVQVGATVRFALTETPTTKMLAIVTRVAPTVDTVTRTIEVIAVPNGASRGARAESFVQAELLGTGGSPVLVVPSSAVQALEGDTVVIVADQRGEGLHIQAVRVRMPCCVQGGGELAHRGAQRNRLVHMVARGVVGRVQRQRQPHRP